MKFKFLIFTIFVSACATYFTPTKRIPSANLNDVQVKNLDRSFPSIFQAWQPISFDGGSDPIVAMARHDLVWQSWNAWGIKCSDEASPGLCTTFSSQNLVHALQVRARLKQLNPKIIMLAEVRYHDAMSNFLPDSSPWWLRDSAGNKIPKKKGTSITDYFLLDFSNSEFQDRVAALCSQIVATGVVDGCMLDWWNNETPAHVALVRKIRAAIGDSAILIANVNGSLPMQSASFLNGIYMEGFGQAFFSSWQTAKSNLLWAKDHFHLPVITAFDAWGNIDADDKAMRFPLALSLIFSDGYFLFGDRLHQHVWHSIWIKNLGKPLGPSVALPEIDGTYRREFENGTVVLNPPSNPTVSLQFNEPRTRASSETKSSNQLLQAGDGDLFMR